MNPFVIYLGVGVVVIGAAVIITLLEERQKQKMRANSYRSPPGTPPSRHGPSGSTSGSPLTSWKSATEETKNSSIIRHPSRSTLNPRESEVKGTQNSKKPPLSGSSKNSRNSAVEETQNSSVRHRSSLTSREPEVEGMKNSSVAHLPSGSFPTSRKSKAEGTRKSTSPELMTCMLCNDKKYLVNFPCGDKIFCEACLEVCNYHKLRKCPLCHKNIENM